MTASIKNRLVMIVFTLVVAFGAFMGYQAITADTADARYEYSCGYRGGYTYHKHTGFGDTWWHYTYYNSGWNEFWYYDNYMGWAYNGWDWCR